MDLAPERTWNLKEVYYNEQQLVSLIVLVISFNLQWMPNGNSSSKCKHSVWPEWPTQGIMKEIKNPCQGNSGILSFNSVQ